MVAADDVTQECGEVKFNNFAFLLPYQRWLIWLRHCAASCRVSGSILDVVIGIYHRHNPSSRTVARGSTQFLTETSREGGVKAAVVWVRQPYYLHVPTV